MSDEWRNELATEEQKEKLRFFGCTWDEGITAGQASDALEDCARQFPDAEADYQKSLPATENQKEKLKFFGCTWNGDITVGKASEALGECARQFPDREAIWELQKRKWVKIPGTFPAKEFDQLDETSSQEVTIQKTEPVASKPVTARLGETPLQYLERTGRTTDPAWQMWAKAKQVSSPEAISQKAETVGNQPADDEELTLPDGHWFPPEPNRGDPKYQAWINPAGQEYGFALDHLRWKETVKQIKAQIETGKLHQDRIAEPNELQQTERSEVSKDTPVEKEPEPPFYLKYPPESERYDSTVEFKQTEAENRRRYDRYHKLVARKEQSRTAPEAGSQKVSALETFLAAGQRLGIRSKKMPEPIAVPAPKSFALDMARVCEITSETKEVVAILSVLMEDEPEKSIAPAATIKLPSPEIPKVSGEGNAAPQPTRFNGLDAAFHPILERLLARDSWPKNDFKSLADEFHFMPSKIYDTLNEWADEVLGDLILDGEDPVVIRRELIAKEKIYG